MVERGLEPRTLGLLDPRSNQLSYTTKLMKGCKMFTIKLKKCTFFISTHVFEKSDPYSLSEVSFTEIPLDDHTMMPLETFWSWFIVYLVGIEVECLLPLFLTAMNNIVDRRVIMFLVACFQFLGNCCGLIKLRKKYDARTRNWERNIQNRECLNEICVPSCCWPNAQCPINHSFFQFYRVRGWFQPSWYTWFVVTLKILLSRNLS